jgi:PKD repeat protein
MRGEWRPMQKISSVGILICVMVVVVLPMVAASGVAGNTTMPDYPGNAAGSGDTILYISPVKPMVGGTITFTLQGSFPSGTWFDWDFGDGGTAHTQAASVDYLYVKTGMYNVNVSVNSEPVASKPLDLTLQKGDIMVHAGSSTFSQLIPGPWSHAGLYIGNDTVLESTSEGVHVSPLYPVWSYPNDTCDGVFRLSGLDNQTRERIVTWALAKNGAPYDFLSLIPPGFKQADCQDVNLKPLCYSYYCSELVWGAYYRNGINLYPKYFLVLPSALVTANYYPTDLVGTHIEKIPAGRSMYAGYYSQVIAGTNPPYTTTLSNGNADYELILVGNNPGPGNDVSEGNSMSNSSIQNKFRATGVVEMTITDPDGRVLSGTTSAIRDSSVETINHDADGYYNDKLACLFNPVQGEYTLQLALPGQDGGTGRISLDTGSWDGDQYAWVAPLNNVPSGSVPEIVHFRIDARDQARVITIPCRGTAPLNVSFIVLSPMENFHDSWDFGDGTIISDNQTVSHQYTVQGTYSVRVTVWNSTITSSVNIPIIVEANPNSLQADFTVDRTSGVLPFTVTCIDKSTGNPTRYNYDFGDGSNSTNKNASHTYRFPGVYTITQTIMKYNPASNSMISSVAVKTDIITVNRVPSIPLVAKFTASPVNGTAPMKVSFTDQSTGSPTFLNYDFGDGINATGPNPVHIYRFPGVYNVTLSILKFDSTSGSMIRNLSVQNGLIRVS